MRIDDGSKVIRKAIKYAEQKHSGQIRKISGSPYVHHPLIVSYVAANFKKSKNLYKLVAAAILHDVIEDTDATPEAEPTDGWGNYDIYLVNNTRLPRTAATASRGFVDLEFNVDQNGRLSNFKIIHSTCPPCNKEAIRLIKEGPQWKLSEGDIPAKVSLTLQF